MQNLLTDLTLLLEQDNRLVAEGKLLKNKVVELALALGDRAYHRLRAKVPSVSASSHLIYAANWLGVNATRGLLSIITAVISTHLC